MENPTTTTILTAAPHQLLDYFVLPDQIEYGENVLLGKDGTIHLVEQTHDAAVFGHTLTHLGNALHAAKAYRAIHLAQLAHEQLARRGFAPKNQAQYNTLGIATHKGAFISNNNQQVTLPRNLALALQANSMLQWYDPSQTYGFGTPVASVRIHEEKTKTNGKKVRSPAITILVKTLGDIEALAQSTIKTTEDINEQNFQPLYKALFTNGQDRLILSNLSDPVRTKEAYARYQHSVKMSQATKMFLPYEWTPERSNLTKNLIATHMTGSFMTGNPTRVSLRFGKIQVGVAGGGYGAGEKNSRVKMVQEILDSETLPQTTQAYVWNNIFDDRWMFWIIDSDAPWEECWETLYHSMISQVFWIEETLSPNPPKPIILEKKIQDKSHSLHGPDNLETDKA